MQSTHEMVNNSSIFVRWSKTPKSAEIAPSRDVVTQTGRVWRQLGRFGGQKYGRDDELIHTSAAASPHTDAMIIPFTPGETS